MSGAIFHDPSERRRRVTRTLVVLFGTATLAVLALFVMTLFVTPDLPREFEERIARTPANLKAVFRPRQQTRALRNAQRKLLGEIATERVVSAASRSSIVAAFYAPWQESGLHSLNANANRITHLMPAWLRLADDGKALDYTDWNPSVAYHNLEVVETARQHHVKLIPVLSNASKAQFDPARAHAVLTDAVVRARVINELRGWLIANGMDGVNIDFENLDPQDARALPQFVAEVRAELAPHHLLTSADVEAAMPRDTWRAIAANCDYVVVMGYDEHSSLGTAGPISSIAWYRTLLHDAVATIPQQKLVMGIGNYAYDWVEGAEGAEPMSYEQALMTARDNFGHDATRAIDFDPSVLNPTFNYKDEDGTGHEVWMLDGVTAANQWRLAWKDGVRNVAVWAFGLEDPSIWQLLDRHTIAQAPDAEQLATIRFPYAVEFVGEGEILRVAATPGDGHRMLDTDRATGLVTDEAYTAFPTPFVIHRTGFVPKTVALTIDDGPSAPYTERMLNVLHKYGVKATFFLIGENIEKDPDAVRRMWEDGHEIGNHSYTHSNMGEVSDVRATLELNATQRAIEAVTGRSTLLFRPPYNADAEPTTREEVLPVVRAADLGYVTVGEFIDPQDWNADGRDQFGRRIQRSAREIADAVIAGVHSGHGNCILLHDGGGDRNQSVKALEIIIPRLRAEGYRFVTVSDLMHTSRGSIMPPVSATDRVFLGDDRVVFGATSRAGQLLAIGFVSAIVLALLRAAILTILALKGLYAERRDVSAPQSYGGGVSVLIAAYNEGRVIEKTIASILRGTRPPDEIIVVDDGSSDDTAAVVESLAARDPRVRLIRQQNQGKSTALNRGILAAANEVLVCIDADTMLHSHAVERLVARFADPLVGAVAGNVKVGNRNRIATILQSVEYTTSQNIDRRAWGLLDAVTVVPGAIGAWRRSAVVAAGGYSTVTVAEDMDLTWTLRRAGWRIDVENDAVSYTEAPETAAALFRQRFRWAYGTLQCLWKHRDALGRYGWFGRAMLPSLWLFQIVFQLLSPIVDLQLGWTVLQVILAVASDRGVTPLMAESLAFFASMFLVFTVVDMLTSAIALRIENEPLKQLFIVPLQRFFYRQLMYAAIVKSVATAIQGLRTGWGKLDRMATVTLPEADA